MGEGQIRCCGSNLQLKQKFGGGYKLLIEFNSQLEDKLKKEMLKGLESYMLYKITEESDIRMDLICEKDGSPNYVDWNPNFVRMFEQLESKKEQFNIATYGFGDTTLEDVFLSVSELNEHHKDNSKIEKVYVSNIPVDCMDKELVAHFEQ